MKMEPTVEKLFEAKIKLSKYNQWFEEIMVSALHQGEQFQKDHNRPMTYKEKQDWVNSKRSLMNL